MVSFRPAAFFAREIRRARRPAGEDAALDLAGARAYRLKRQPAG